MVERSLCMREVRGSIPRISIFNFFTGFDVEHPLIYHGACRNTHSFIESIRLIELAATLIHLLLATVVNNHMYRGYLSHEQSLHSS